MSIRSFLILVADRNPHVRAFLRRELSQAGYRIRLAETGRDLLGGVSGRERVDLLIVDPDLPDMGGEELLDLIQGRFPNLPVIVHTYLPWGLPRPAGSAGTETYVEKNGGSVEFLKRLIDQILKERAIAEPLKP